MSGISVTRRTSSGSGPMPVPGCRCVVPTAARSKVRRVSRWSGVR